MENTFIYGHKGCHIDYKGIGFDSLLELRYAISIQDEYAFLRESIKIFYDPISQTSTNYLREGIKKYTPDFLIRNLATRKAYLVEVKPHAFDDFSALALFQNICDHYIAAGKYDWEYKVVFEEDIFLAPKQRELYDAILANKMLYRKQLRCNSLDLRKHAALYQKPGNEHIMFVKRNKSPLIPCN